MFAQKDIQNALNDLFALVNPETIAMLYETYDEEIEDISLALLEKVFTNTAEKVPCWRLISTFDKDAGCFGTELFTQRGVMLLSHTDNTITSKRQCISDCSELWLLEDMTFVHIRNIREEIICSSIWHYVLEDRSIIKTIEHEDDLFFSPEELVCTLDDICMFAELKQRGPNI